MNDKVKIASIVELPEDQGITASFSDGEAFDARLDALAPEIIQKLAVLGLKNKVRDSYAGEDDVTVAKSKANGVYKNLVDGIFRASGGGGGAISDLATAMSRIFGQPIETVVEFLGAAEDAQIKEFKKQDAIKVEILKLKQERLAAKAGGGELTNPFA